MKELIIELVKENLKLEEQIEALKCEFEKEISEYKDYLKDLKEQMEKLKSDDQVWKSDDGNTTFNLTDETITVKPHKKMYYKKD